MYTKGDAGAKPSHRRELVRQDPGLGMLAAQLLFAVQDELYRRLEAAGYRDLRPRHGIVIAYLDDQGSWATELAALSDRHKQLVGRTVDELEALGYVTRAPDPADRRAKLVVPTPRGRAVVRLPGMSSPGGGWPRRHRYGRPKRAVLLRPWSDRQVCTGRAG